ncbi:tryptophan 7-halogenase [Streptomyces coeruleorubidus]|uniref:FAD-dependent monooxygenase n=1 Tax=Streptomyces coeruleorubidus TaxID=116188 RepID=UPI00237F9909|nr:FAD-dependent monooxygenase [Streptomyces coeruleorubidus]WDV49071.1 tryptophan 7-halogenase [Streptomyces coeruleorubidus]
MTFEVIVAGGGPAGAVAALVLARAGRRVLLVDKGTGGPASSPFRIGETLLPAARPLLHDLGLWPEFATGPHLRCVGTYASWGSKQLHGRSHLHDPHGHGWHLDRTRFDAFLRSAAGTAGAELRRAEAVPHLTHVGDRRVLIRGDGRLEEVRCDWVVDATGRRAVIGRRRGRRRKQDRLMAVFALFGRRLPGHRTEDAELRTLVEAVPGGWWYTARVPAGRLVAYLTDADLTDSALRTAEGFLDAIGTTRHVRIRLDGYDPAHAPAPRWTAAHGLRLSPAAGPGWIAAGDAALAFDPLSSQGILTALHTGARAGRTVDLCLSGETAALADYSLFLQRITDAYERHHAETYGQEQRWPEHPFWERRQQAP